MLQTGHVIAGELTFEVEAVRELQRRVKELRHRAESPKAPTDLFGFDAPSKQVRGARCALLWGFPAQLWVFFAWLWGFPALLWGFPAQLWGFPARLWGFPAQLWGFPAQLPCPSGCPWRAGEPLPFIAGTRVLRMRGVVRWAVGCFLYCTVSCNVHFLAPQGNAD